MKNMIKKYRKAKGFTLVELLIVIIIIGILAGMMMLSTGSATDRAEATKIVADLRIIKSASLLYYIDNNNTWTTEIKSLDKYLDQDMSKRTDYQLGGTGTNEAPIFVSYTKPSSMDAGVKTKLHDMAANAGLYNEKECTSTYTANDTVYMIVKRSDKTN